MTDTGTSRRMAAFLLLFIFLVGAIVVLGWLLKAALLALGIMAKIAVSLGGLLLLVLLLFFAYRVLAPKD